MFVINWFKKLLNSLSLFKKDAKVVFLGLENAGKSSLMVRLKYDKFIQMDPTVSVHSEEIEIGRVRFKAFDLGGHDTARRVWDKYFLVSDAIIYMVDAASEETLDLSRDELWKILKDERMNKVPLLVFGNKIDKKNVMSEDNLRMRLGLDEDSLKAVGLSNKTIELFMCSVAKNVGILKGFEWLNTKV
jgi:GTP-binding protein SAR1